MTDLKRLAALQQSLAHSSALTGPTGADGRVDVIVPVYNAVEETMTCLESVALKTRTPCRLIVINDGSSDPGAGRLLAAINGAAPYLITIDRTENRGFVRTVNEGMRASRTNDVVLLNADTRVTENWLGKLEQVAHSRSRVATVTPLTNNGTICSVPDVRQSNAVPDGYDVDSFGALIEALTLRIYPEVPTGVGFCLLISRAALDEVGFFDADAFPRGYGEENDFCQRAIRAGFVNLIADDTFVYHTGGVSFGEEQSRTLLERNLRTLVRRHPHYLRDVNRFLQAHPLRTYHAYLQRNIAARRTGSESILTRVLHVLQEGDATGPAVRNTASAGDSSTLSYVLVRRRTGLHVDEYFRGQLLRSLDFAVPGRLGEFGAHGSEAYDKAIGTVCWALNVDEVHDGDQVRCGLNVTAVGHERGTSRSVVAYRAMQMADSTPSLTGSRRVMKGRRIVALFRDQGASRILRFTCVLLVGHAATQLRETSRRLLHLKSALWQTWRK